MWVTRVSIARPVFAAMVMFALCVLGIFSYTKLGVEQLPDLNLPVAYVDVLYPGASPQSVEEEITKKIEEALNGIAGVKRITSRSFEGRSQSSVEFNLNADMARGMQDVRDKIAAVQATFPKDAKTPLVLRVNNEASEPVAVIGVLSNTKTHRDVSMLAELQVVRRLQRIDGVAFIKISGSNAWGLETVEAGRGTTSTWIKPTQHQDYVGGAFQPKYIDGDGNETTNGDGFTTLPAWSPIYLDKGELTFDTGGNLVSPVEGTQLETVYLAGGKGALTINIDYSASTQFSSAFAVLSQSQDGAPEGDLVGVTIGNDGLVSASFSNGSQKSLAKILLANFSSPVGLRQIGDSSFLTSAASGKPILGTPGSAGFGTLRAGATERANVDLTQELVDLITAQRNFQANAKAIETSSTMTSAIINLRS